MLKLGIVFPGQGTQYVGMGKDFFENCKAARDAFAEAEEILKFDIAKLCFQGPQEALDQTVNTQTTILTVNFVAYRVFTKEIEIKPQVIAGHSLGEYSALHAAGALDFADALPLVGIRGKYQQEAVASGTGCMAAIIGLEKAVVQDTCRVISKSTGKIVDLATINAPTQFVISGHRDAVEKAIIRARERGATRAIELPITVPCHSSLMDEAAKKFEQDLDRIELQDCEVQVIPNYNPDIFYSKENVKELLARIINSPVRWQETIEKMIAIGVNTIVEVGPSRRLSGLIKRINKNIKILNVENMDSLDKTVQALTGPQMIYDD